MSEEECSGVKSGQRTLSFYCLVFEITFPSFYLTILLSVIIAEASEITERQSSFPGKIADGDG